MTEPNVASTTVAVATGPLSPARSTRVLGRLTGGSVREGSSAGLPCGDGDAPLTSEDSSAVPFGGVLGKTPCGCPAFSNGREGFFGSEMSVAFDMRLPRSPRFQIAARVALGPHASAETWGQQVGNLGTKWTATEFVRRHVAQTKGVWLRPVPVAEQLWKLDSATSLVSGEKVALRRFLNEKASQRSGGLPAVGDVLVWQRSRDFPFGHVAVVVNVVVVVAAKNAPADVTANGSTQSFGTSSDPTELGLAFAANEEDTPAGGYVDVAEQNHGDMRSWGGRSHARRLPLAIVRRGVADDNGTDEFFISLHDSITPNLVGWVRVDSADVDFSHNDVGDNFHIPVSAGSIRRFAAVRDVTLPWLSPKNNPCDFFVKRSLVVDGNLGEGAVAAEKDTPDGFYVLDGDMWSHIRKATHTLHDVAMAATWKVVRHASSTLLLERYFGIPSELHYLIRRSLRVLPPMLGRFDFGFDPAAGVKMLEYNCDSSAALYECGEVQERWAAHQATILRAGEDSGSSQDSCRANVGASSGSFLRQKLLEYWEYIANTPSLCPPHRLIHFMVDDDDEERYTALYVARCAQQCGFRAKICVKLVDFRFARAAVPVTMAGDDVADNTTAAAATSSSSAATPSRFAVFSSPSTASPNESPSRLRSSAASVTRSDGDAVGDAELPTEDTSAQSLLQRAYLNEMDIVDLDGERVQLVYKTWSWDTVLSQYRAQQAERQPSSTTTRQGAQRPRNPDEPLPPRESAPQSVAPSRPSLSDILLNERIHTIEPFWKMITGSKALLPFMFEHAPEHPNMVYASFRLTDRLLCHPYLSKPVNGRAGQNITMFDAVANEAERHRLIKSREAEEFLASDGVTLPEEHTPHSRGDGSFGRSAPEEKESSEGKFFDSLVVYQRRVALHKFSNKYYPIFCGWVIGDQFGGVVVREDTSKITKLGSIVAPCRVQR